MAAQSSCQHHSTTGKKEGESDFPNLSSLNVGQDIKYWLTFDADHKITVTTVDFN